MLTYTSVWNNVVLNLNKELGPGRENLKDGVDVAGLELAMLTIKRSGETRPLRITVEPSLDTDLSRRRKTEESLLLKFLPVIKTHIGRLERLSIVVADTTVAKWLADEISSWEAAEKLEELALICTDPYGTATLQNWTFEDLTDPAPARGVLMPTPILRKLTLSVAHFFQPQLLEELHDLESLTLTRYTNMMQARHSPFTLLEKVQHLPNLKHLELDGVLCNDLASAPGAFAPPAEFPESITLPSLTSINVQHMSSAYIHPFFQRLDAPALESLSMGHLQYFRLNIETITLISEDGRFPRLHTFHINDACNALWRDVLLFLHWPVTMSVKGIASCICARRNHVAFFDNEPYAPALETPWEHGQWLCPKLVDLTIEAHGEKHCRNLRRMLRDRKEVVDEKGDEAHCTKLEKLTVTDCHCHEPLPDEFRTAFGKYCTEFHPPPRKYIRQVGVRYVPGYTAPVFPSHMSILDVQRNWLGTDTPDETEVIGTPHEEGFDRYPRARRSVVVLSYS